MSIMHHARVAQLRRFGRLVLLAAAGAAGCSDGSESKMVDASSDSIKPGDFDLAPAKLYSAFVPNHAFVVPVKADVRVKEWTCSDPTAVSFETTGERSVNVRINKATAPVTITATTAGGFSASATLTITAASEEQWQAGSARFNNGKPAFPGRESSEDSDEINARIAAAAAAMMPLEAGFFLRDGACTSCHGELTGQEEAVVIPVTVRNTPTQIGGYTDEELKTIITMGSKPRGVDTGELLGSRVIWKFAHRWEATPEELNGLVIYLRSLPPREQESEQDAFRGPRGRPSRPPPEDPPPDEIPPEEPPAEETPEEGIVDASAADGAPAAAPAAVDAARATPSADADAGA
jgi:hypothetical protein